MLNKQIKALRTAHNLTQVELADRLSVTKQTVSNWENDNIQPSVDMLVKLSDFFGVTTDYLLGRNTDDYLNVQGLTREQIAHIHWLIEDLKSKN